MMNPARNRSEDDNARKNLLMSRYCINDIDILALKSDGNIIQQQIAHFCNNSDDFQQ